MSRFDAAFEWARRYVDGGVIPTAVLGIATTEGIVALDAFGATDGRAARVDDHHRLFSVTKPLVGLTAARAIEPGLLVETVDGRDRADVKRLAAWCGPGKTVAFLGSSGVGKSTLVNALRGSDSIGTQAVRVKDGTGRHTTTVREMHRLDQGGWLLDLPLQSIARGEYLIGVDAEAAGQRSTAYVPIRIQ